MGWARALMAYRGIYAGVEARPGSPLEWLLIMVQSRLEQARVHQTLVLALAAQGSERLREAFEGYRRLALPRQAADEETQREAMHHLLEHWDDQQQRFSGLVDGLLRFRDRRSTDGDSAGKREKPS